MSQLRSIERRLRKDNVIIHGIAHKTNVSPITLALTLITSTLGLADISVVDARWIGRADGERRPLWVRRLGRTARAEWPHRAEGYGGRGDQNE